MAKKALVMKLGGGGFVSLLSLDVQGTTLFIKALKSLIEQYEKVILIVGGGPPARRVLQDLGEVLGPPVALELTRKHARELNQVMCDLGMEFCGVIPTNVLELRQAITDTKFGVAVGGLELGQTTDAVAMSAAQALTNNGYEVSLVIVSNIEAIYNMPPEMAASQAIKTASLDWMIEEGILINDVLFFKDGMNVPLDPVAVNRYQSFAHKVPLYFTNAGNTSGVEQFLLGEPVTSGTVIFDGVDPSFYS
jgi:uridylate kinase